jgi:hypothetical protein
MNSISKIKTFALLEPVSKLRRGPFQCQGIGFISQKRLFGSLI